MVEDKFYMFLIKLKFKESIKLIQDLYLSTDYVYLVD
jgi:hypothetical protein